MKSYEKMRVQWRGLTGLLLMGSAWVLPVPAATTVDIGDFLMMQAGQSWGLEGTASYSFFRLDVDIDLQTAEGAEFHGVPTTLLSLEADASSFGQTARVIQELNISLDSEHVRLHSRIGRVYFNGQLDDEDIEVYRTPASILPRMVTVGERYPFLSELESGDVDDAVLVEGIEIIETPQGPVEALKLVAFADNEVPLTLWLGRNVGYLKVEVSTTANDIPLVISGLLKETSQTWVAETIDRIWADTVNNGGGWRYADWFGHFWTSGVGANWINHLGFSWAYCLGESDNLWMFLPGSQEWLWTRSDMYPAVYDAARGHYLYYVFYPGSTWFWDYALGDWIDLGG